MRMQISFLLSLAMLLFASAFNEEANDNIALYWGQNSAGGHDTQDRLSHYCESAASDIVLISFLHEFKSTGGLPSINVANACEGTYFAGTNLLRCDTIAEDIATCQSLGRKVLLSLGGAVGSYGLSSVNEAEDFADQLWNLFGNGQSATRPFGTSVIDGFDLDIEAGDGTFYPNFVNRLREHFNQDPTRKYYIGAAPQCPIPDHFLNAAMTQSDIDFYFVQFYNNYCGLQALGTSNFNYDAWHTFATTQGLNKNAKVYLGVPAAPRAAGSGYLPVQDVIKVAKELQRYSSFGGVMMWDASQAWLNNDFAGVVKRGISNGNPESTTFRPTSSTKSLSSSSFESKSSWQTDVISSKRRDPDISVSSVTPSTVYTTTTIKTTSTVSTYTHTISSEEESHTPTSVSSTVLSSTEESSNSSSKSTDTGVVTKSSSTSRHETDHLSSSDQHISSSSATTSVSASSISNSSSYYSRSQSNSVITNTLTTPDIVNITTAASSRSSGSDIPLTDTTSEVSSTTSEITSSSLASVTETPVSTSISSTMSVTSRKSESVTLPSSRTDDIVSSESVTPTSSSSVESHTSSDEASTYSSTTLGSSASGNSDSTNVPTQSESHSLTDNSATHSAAASDSSQGTSHFVSDSHTETQSTSHLTESSSTVLPTSSNPSDDSTVVLPTTVVPQTSSADLPNSHDVVSSSTIVPSAKETTTVDTPKVVTTEKPSQAQNQSTANLTHDDIPLPVGRASSHGLASLLLLFYFI